MPGRRTRDRTRTAGSSRGSPPRTGDRGPCATTFDDLASAAVRAARLADPEARVETQGEVLVVRDFLDAYVLEWTVHHLDLVAHLPGVPGPPDDGLAASRATVEALLGEPVPAALADADALRVVTGRRAPTAAERAALGPLVDRLPVTLG